MIIILSRCSYIIDLMEDIDLCVERNIHERKRDEIEKVRLKGPPASLIT